jgi:glycine/D-amino acid oxidase-like deaminating enzyme
MKNYEVIVIGGGAVGLATASELAKQPEKRTLVLEGFDFINQKGSSAGLSRQFRIQYAQKYMAKLALDSIPCWKELQSKTSDRLIDPVGSLWFGDPSISSQEGGIQAAMKVMDELNIPYEPLSDAQQIEKRFPFKNLPKNYSGFFQADGGIIDLEATLKALYTISNEAENVDLLSNTAVTNIQSLPGGEIIVSTAQEEFKTQKLILTPGSYINNLLKFFNLSVAIDIWEMSSAYYRKTEDIKLPTWFVFQEPQDKRLFYGFPEVDWANPGYFRVAPDIPDRIIQDPSERSGKPSPDSLSLNDEWVANNMCGLSPEAEFTSTCLITLSQDLNKQMMLDTLPDHVPNHENILVYTAGWGAKFIPLLGKILSQLATEGKTEYDISNFTIDYQSTKQSIQL